MIDYKKYRWFLTSAKTLVVGGKNAKQNDSLLKEIIAAGENYFPEGMSAPHWYQPVDRGLESKIAEKMAFLRQLNQKAKK